MTKAILSLMSATPMPSKSLLIDNYAQVWASLKPHTLFMVKSPGLELCLVKTDKGPRLFQNACPHLNVPFSQSGVCNAYGEVVCKEHGHRYGVHDGRERDGRPEALRFYDYVVVDDKLYVIN